MTAANATRQRLLDTALALFAEHGVEAVSLRSINAAAGVSPGILHYHFGNRDTLLDALLHRELPALAGRRSVRVDTVVAAGVRASPMDVANALLSPYGDYLDTDAANPGLFLRLLMRLVLDGSPLPEVVDHTRQADFTRLADLLARIVPGLDHTTAGRRLAVAADMALFMTARRTAPAEIDRNERTHPAAGLADFIAAGLAAPG